MCYKKYYIRFFLHCKNIFKTNSWTEFMVKSKVFFKIFFQKGKKMSFPRKRIQKKQQKTGFLIKACPRENWDWE